MDGESSESSSSCSWTEREDSLMPSLDSEFDSQEEEFRYRNKKLLRIVDHFPEDPHVYQILWERELRVRNLERENLLLRRCFCSDNPVSAPVETEISFEKDHTLFEEADDSIFFDAIMSTSDTSTEGRILTVDKAALCRKSLWLHLKMLVGTSFNLICYSLLVGAANDLIEIAVYTNVPAAWREYTVSGLLFHILYGLLGISLLCISLDFLWFATPRVSRFLYFDFQNGKRLGTSMYRMTSYLEENKQVKSMLFLVGYCMVSHSIAFISANFYLMLFGDGSETWMKTYAVYDLIIIFSMTKLLVWREAGL